MSRKARKRNSGATLPQSVSSSRSKQKDGLPHLKSRPFLHVTRVGAACRRSLTSATPTGTRNTRSCASYSPKRSTVRRAPRPRTRTTRPQPRSGLCGTLCARWASRAGVSLNRRPAGVRLPTARERHLLDRLGAPFLLSVHLSTFFRRRIL